MPKLLRTAGAEAEAVIRRAFPGVLEVEGK
jgi:hypothetical protein